MDAALAELNIYETIEAQKNVEKIAKENGFLADPLRRVLNAASFLDLPKIEANNFLSFAAEKLTLGDAH